MANKKNVLLAKSASNSIYLKKEADGFLVNNAAVALPTEAGTLALVSKTVADVGDGLSVDESRKASVKINSTDKILSADANGIATTLKFSYNSTDKKVSLLGKNDAEITFFDATDFVKDGMLNSVALTTEDDKDYMVFTWNTDAGKEALKVDITKFSNVYTAEDGVKLDGTTFKADWEKVAKSAELTSFKTEVASTYETKTNAASTYETIANVNNFKTEVASTYATTASVNDFKTEVASTYETISNVAATYATIASLTGDYLKKDDAETTYAKKTDLEVVTKALSAQNLTWDDVTLEDIYDLVKAMATTMGATIA